MVKKPVVKTVQLKQHSNILVHLQPMINIGALSHAENS